MEIVTAADQHYIPHAAAMLHSLFQTHPGRRFRVNFLHRAETGQAHFAGLAALCERFGSSLRAIQVAPTNLEGLPIRPPYTEEAWYRLFLHRLLPEATRALWLDADTIILRPIDELWDTDLRDTCLAACPNALLYRDRVRVERMGISDRHRYFNTGVLLLDLERLRREGAETLLRQIAHRHPELIRNADQDVLNCAYVDRYTRLPLKWNVLTSVFYNVPETLRSHGLVEYREALREPRIVHFTGQAAIKPWYFKCGHPHREAYLRHRALAGWGEPPFTDRTLRYRIMRRVPLRLRETISALRQRRLAEALSYYI